MTLNISWFYYFNQGETQQMKSLPAGQEYVVILIRSVKHFSFVYFT